MDFKRCDTYHIGIFFVLSIGLPLIFIAEAKKVNLGEGDSIIVRLEIDESTRIHELSFDTNTLL
jgi:hypothetical protein